MKRFPCPYLHAEVELSDEREGHIFSKHPDLLPEHFDHIAQTLADPDAVRRDVRFPSTRLFSRRFDNVKRGKFVVVLVVSDPPPEGRYWIVTAYIARKLVEEVIEWMRA